MKLNYTLRCDQLEASFCRMIERESSEGDWDWGILNQYGQSRGYTATEIYLVATNLGCHNIPEKVLAAFK